MISYSSTLLNLILYTMKAGGNRFMDYHWNVLKSKDIVQALIFEKGQSITL